MNRLNKAVVVIASFSFIVNLVNSNYKLAALTGFIAIMLLLIGIEEQL